MSRRVLRLARILCALMYRQNGNLAKSFLEYYKDQWPFLPSECLQLGAISWSIFPDIYFQEDFSQYIFPGKLHRRSVTFPAVWVYRSYFLASGRHSGDVVLQIKSPLALETLCCYFVFISHYILHHCIVWENVFKIGKGFYVSHFLCFVLSYSILLTMARNGYESVLKSFDRAHILTFKMVQMY